MFREVIKVVVYAATQVCVRAVAATGAGVPAAAQNDAPGMGRGGEDRPAGGEDSWRAAGVAARHGLHGRRVAPAGGILYIFTLNAHSWVLVLRPRGDTTTQTQFCLAADFSYEVLPG